jgi:hypothetical protein
MANGPFDGGVDVKVASLPVKEFERERYPYTTPIFNAIVVQLEGDATLRK